MKKLKRLVIELIVFALAIVVDQLTKVWAVNTLKDKESIPIIRNIVEFHYLPNGNTGAAFGMLKGQQGLFLAIAAIVVIVIGFILYNMPFNKKYRLIDVLLVLIAAGGAGNMIDRFMQNYVVDFIYISCINFPIFNVADMYVSISTVLLAIILLFVIKEDDYKEITDAVKSPFKKKAPEQKDEKNTDC